MEWTTAVRLTGYVLCGRTYKPKVNKGMTLIKVVLECKM